MSTRKDSDNQFCYHRRFRSILGSDMIFGCLRFKILYVGIVNRFNKLSTSDDNIPVVCVGVEALKCIVVRLFARYVFVRTFLDKARAIFTTTLSTKKRESDDGLTKRTESFSSWLKGGGALTNNSWNINYGAYTNRNNENILSAYSDRTRRI